MIGMNFVSFLILMVIGAVVAVVYHYGLRYRHLQGIDSVFGKLVIGWIGAWLGSPVLGHWLWKYESVYIIPAILGAIAFVHLNALFWKSLASLPTRTVSPPTEIPKPRATAA